MNYFTSELYENDCDEVGPLKAAYDAYLSRIRKLESVRPSDVWTIADPYFVHDALVCRVKLDRTKKSLELVLRCGNLQIDYFDLVLNYEDAIMSNDSEFALACVARATETCTLFWGHCCYVHELDCTEDGGFKHSLLFHPGLYFTIDCSSLRWERVAQSDRNLPKLKDRFPAGPLTPPPSMQRYW